jgi:hypothetical protein
MKIKIIIKLDQNRYKMSLINIDDVIRAVNDNNISQLEEYWKLCQDGNFYFKVYYGSVDVENCFPSINLETLTWLNDKATYPKDMFHIFHVYLRMMYLGCAFILKGSFKPELFDNLEQYLIIEEIDILFDNIIHIKQFDIIKYLINKFRNRYNSINTMYKDSLSFLLACKAAKVNNDLSQYIIEHYGLKSLTCIDNYSDQSLNLLKDIIKNYTSN